MRLCEANKAGALFKIFFSEIFQLRLRQWSVETKKGRVKISHKSCSGLFPIFSFVFIFEITFMENFRWN